MESVSCVCVGEERVCQTEGIDLKDIGFFGELWPQYWSWGGNDMKFIPEEIIDIDYKLSFEFSL